MTSVGRPATAEVSRLLQIIEDDCRHSRILPIPPIPYPRSWRARRFVSLSDSSSISSESSNDDGDGAPEASLRSATSFVEPVPPPPLRDLETLLTAARRPWTQTLCVRRFVGMSRLVSGSRSYRGMSASSLERYVFWGTGSMAAKPSKIGGEGDGGVLGRERIAMKTKIRTRDQVIDGGRRGFFYGSIAKAERSKWWRCRTCWSTGILAPTRRHYFTNWPST